MHLIHKWNKYREVTVRTRRDKIMTVQARVCIKCGRVKARSWGS